MRIVVRNGARYMQVTRHGKVAYVKVRSGHYAKHAKKIVRPVTQGSKPVKPGAA